MIEHAILGAMLHPEMVDDVLSSTSPRQFSSDTLRTIYQNIAEVAECGASPDLVTVTHQLRLNGGFSANIGAILTECVDAAPFASQLQEYLRRFEDDWRKREARKLAAEIMSFTGSGAELDDIIGQHLETAETKSLAVGVKPVLSSVFKTMEERAKNKGTITGMPTGFYRIDKQLSGLNNGNLIVLAARPSVGKTAFALNIIDHVCIHNKVPVLMFSLEMTKEELVERLLLSRARVDSGVAKASAFTQGDYGRMTSASEVIHAAPLRIVDRCGLTMTQIRSISRAEKRKHNIGLVVIDYLGLVGGDREEYKRVTDASIAAKRMAKDLGIPVIAIHQLNRGSEKREQKRPTMSDLRSSGQVEQDADSIILLHRERLHPEEPAEIIIDKNRHGPTGIIRATWNGPYNTFHEQS